MLQINNLTFSIGERLLFDGISWTVAKSKRLALIGPNGAGKTTLFRIITGQIQLDAKAIQYPKDYQIGYLPQEEVAFSDGNILQTVLEGRQEVLTLSEKIEKLRNEISINHDQDDKLQQLGNLEHQYETLGGYRLESEAKTILAGLGFSETDFTNSISTFSGGWRMRVYLARLLLKNPDLLLLDEPTNHLDLPSLEWLEQYLIKFEGSIIIISHDRFFIDRLAQEIFELENGKLEHYAGNYHFYEKEKVKRRELLIKRYEQIREEKEKQERFIERFRYKATKAAQVQSRVKQLEKLEQIQLPTEKKQIEFKISVDVTSYKDVLDIRDLSFKYDSDWVLEDINLNIYREEKVALVGINGAGKTTLTRLIVGQLAPQQGTITLGERTKIGYYAQHQVDTLNLENTIYDEVASTVAKEHIPNIRNVLGVFQFTGDEVYKPIKVLSGGEKARVSLAKILLCPVNFLIMDEPTNHLDMASKEALENALAFYNGTLILISHDRYFLDKLVNRVIELDNKKLRLFEGNYTDYLAGRERMQAQETVNVSEKESGVKRSRDLKRQQAEARQAISKQRQILDKDIKIWETKIEELETRKNDLEQEMLLPETYQNGELIAKLQKEYAAVKIELENSFQKWEAVQTEMDSLMEQLSKKLDSL